MMRKWTLRGGHTSLRQECERTNDEGFAIRPTQDYEEEDDDDGRGQNRRPPLLISNYDFGDGSKNNDVDV